MHLLPGPFGGSVPRGFCRPAEAYRSEKPVLRQRGKVAYGILPFPILEEDLRTMHANDERISLKAYTWGQEMLARIVLETAQQP